MADDEAKLQEFIMAQTEKAPKRPYNHLPELSAPEARTLFDRYNQQLEADPNRPVYEPKTADEVLNTMLDKYGHGFFSGVGEGINEFMKKMPQDVEGYRVPLKGMFEGTEYPESSRMLYFRKLPKTS